ncbi:MAG: hypothetical protein ABIC04_08070 [Nanoarchaeota archaeon]
MKSKKSSLSLSVNAIVILIIAITMLGLGLGFVKMLFGSATDKFIGIVSEEQDPEIPRPSNPVTLSRTVVMTNPGKDQAIKIALYNPTSTEWNSVKPEISCGTNDPFTSTTNAKKISRGQYVIFGALIQVPSDEGEGTHLCEVTFVDPTGTGTCEVGPASSAAITACAGGSSNQAACDAITTAGTAFCEYVGSTCQAVDCGTAPANDVATCGTKQGCTISGGELPYSTDFTIQVRHK